MEKIFSISTIFAYNSVNIVAEGFYFSMHLLGVITAYTSSFYGIGKTRWFDALKENITVDDTFKDLSNSPSEVTENQLQLITRFVLKAYKSPQQNCLTTARLDAIRNI